MDEKLPIYSSYLSELRNFFGFRTKLLILICLSVFLLITLLLFWAIKNSEKPKPLPISSLPPIRSSQEAQDRVMLIVDRFIAPSAAKVYQKALYDAATYTNPDRPPAIVENDRAGRYFGIYNQMVGQYYATRDPEILALAQQLREFIKQTYPSKYASVNRTNGWEIKGE